MEFIKQGQLKKFKFLVYGGINFLKKNVVAYIMLLLFGCSIVLSLSIICPTLMAHKLYIIGIESPKLLQVEGLLIVKDKDGRNSVLPGVEIEIGGYKTYTDQDGKYRIKFLSKEYEEIPVIIHAEDGTVIKRISFNGNEYKKIEELILDGK